MRYKVSKNLTYQSKDVIEAQHPEKIMLPKTHLSSSFIFARRQILCLSKQLQSLCKII